MPNSRSNSEKAKALRETGALNPRPQSVVDTVFQDQPFFDPLDIVQVKYEMVRRVLVDGESVTQASSSFGFSRPSFYQAHEALERGGLPELVPRRRGPRGGHKITNEVLEFLEQAIATDPSVDMKALSHQVQQHFGRTVHPRSIERGLNRRQKKTEKLRTSP